jgi:hypothetical protein
MDSYEAKPTLQNLFQDYLFSSREAATKAFDQANRDRLDDTIGSIRKVFSTQLLLFAHGLTGVRFDAFVLLKTAMDTLISALHLARHRARIEVACLLRSALESACTALHISRSETAYQSFLADSYHSTKSINAAKQEIPVLGEIWGALSQVAVHTNRWAHGPKLERDDSDGHVVMSVHLDLNRSAAQPFEDAAILTLISLSAEIVARAVTLCLLDENPSRPGWRRAPGTSLALYDAGSTAIDKHHREFLSAATRAKT